MNFRTVQAPSAVVMIRPHRFRVNPETLADNAFQEPLDDEIAGTVVAARARDEFDAAVEQVRAAGVTVHVFDDHGELDTPTRCSRTTGSPPIRAAGSRCTRCMPPTGAGSAAAT